MITIVLHLNNQTEFSHYRWKKFDTNFKYISNSSKTTMNITAITSHKRSSQYIWCVNHYGPNNQLKDFVKCCIIAMINNYTLIIPPLFPHHAQKHKGIQLFDHFYDLKQLRHALNFITFDQFISKPKINSNKMMIDCYLQQIELVAARVWYPRNTLISIQRYYKINIDFHHLINLSRNFHMSELFNKSNDCSSIFLHIHYTTFRQFFLFPNIYIKRIFEHLYRTPLIQRMTSQLIKQLPQLVIGKNHSQTNLNTLAVIHMRIGDHIVMNISMYIKQILYLLNNGVHFTHLHIMCPLLNSADIKQLTDNLPIVFTTSQHLLPHVNFVLDSYLFDVLEQEIAYQAPIFIASPWTTYSATVLMQKVYQEQGTVYVLSTKKNNHPLLVTKQNVKYFEQ
ncbi:unnamed protein product [Rotaria sordida]|uniref:GDP-fucose protein O-fucosyltransferase 2 n=2 Tax=Rotaria sordida TaxID=392033 RepID=A0A813QLB4_9BILA|nr:unnamed protein product [Rotaria sordida]CAF0815868.1 unnamed protein product [Rotaria sordida]